MHYEGEIPGHGFRMHGPSQPEPAAGGSDGAARSVIATRAASTPADRIPAAPGVQPHGAMIVVDLRDMRIRHASGNIEELAGRPALDARPAKLAEVVGERQSHQICNALSTSDDDGTSAVVLGMVLEHSTAPVDVIAHLHRDRAYLELVPTGEDPRGPMDALAMAQSLTRRIAPETALAPLAGESVRLLRAVLGYDRVSFWKLSKDGDGRLVAESRRVGAGDLVDRGEPQRHVPDASAHPNGMQLIRMIADADEEPIGMWSAPGCDPSDLDMDFARLRPPSEGERERIRAEGFRAMLSIPIVVDGTTWGLIICHHRGGHAVSEAMLRGVDLFARFLSLQIPNVEMRALTDATAAARRRLEPMFEGLVGSPDFAKGVTDRMDGLRSLLDCAGLGFWSSSVWSSVGAAPDRTGASALLTRVAESAPSDDAALRIRRCADARPSASPPDYGGAMGDALVIPLCSRGRAHLVAFRDDTHFDSRHGLPNSIRQHDPVFQPARPWPPREAVGGHGSAMCPSSSWDEIDFAVAEAVQTRLREALLDHNDFMAEERSRAERRQSVVNEELGHRLKNVIAVAKSIVAQTGAHARSVPEYAKSVEGRLRALAHAHDHSLNSTAGGDLATLLEAEAVLHRHGGDARRVVLAGESVLLDKRAFGVVALVVHEMMTNAAKYGALSVPEGRLHVSWGRTAGGGCQIVWTESGGPSVRRPIREGFGSKLIRATMTHDLGGEVDLDYAPSGLTARFAVPAGHWAAGAVAPSRFAPGATPAPSASANGLAILLVEDQALVAIETEDLLRRLGAREVHRSPDADHATSFLAEFVPDLAVLDFSLGDGTSEAVADRLLAMKVPLLLATGYSSAAMPAHLRNVPTVRKPFSVESLGFRIGEAMGQSSVRTL